MRLVRSQSAEADALSGFRKSARAAKVIDGLLPPPIALGSRAAAYIAEELEAVIVARANGADDEEVRALVKRLVAVRKNARNEAA